MKICTFDIGGSKLAWSVADENGHLIAPVVKISTPQTSTEIAQVLHQAMQAEKFDAAAIATAGVVFANKPSVKPHNLPAGYQNLNFAEILGVPYIIENDANAAAYAELKCGALQNTQNGAVLTLGTAVGCAIIANGQLLHGKSGAVGEYDFTFCGTSLKTWAEHVGLKELDCFKIYELSKQGQNGYRQVYNAWEEELISGLDMLNKLLDVEVIALSGSLAQIVDYAKVQTVINLLNPHNPPQIKLAKNDAEAGLIGAALLLIDNKKGIKK